MRFRSKDPIGYVDGTSLYAGYFVVTSVDPSGMKTQYSDGCGSEPWNAMGFGSMIDDVDVAGMQYTKTPLVSATGKPMYGRTVGTPSVDCACAECCGKWHMESIQVEYQLTIFLDIDQMNARGFPWDFEPAPKITIEGVYGHEQAHVVQMMAQFKNGYNAEVKATVDDTTGKGFGAGDLGKLRCENACLEIEAQVSGLAVDVADLNDHDPDGYPANGRPYRPVGRMPR